MSHPLIHCVKDGLKAGIPNQRYIYLRVEFCSYKGVWGKLI